MRTTQRFVMALLAGIAAGCSGSRDAGRVSRESSPPPPRTESLASAQDQPEGVSPSQDSPRAGPSEQEPAPAAATDPATDPAPSPAQIATDPDDAELGDNPPSWWTTDPIREHGQVGVTAQATAESLRAARKLAVDRGLDRLSTLIGREVGRFEVWPAVARPGPDGQFIVYVMVRTTEEP